MKIAQIAPLFESVPPRLYGGTERVVSYLTEELVRQGHQVTLFASADSNTTAKLVPCAPRALRLDPAVRDPIPHFMLMLDKVRERADDFDVLHFHIDYLHTPLFRSFAAKTLTTLHGRQDLPDNMPFYARFRDLPLVSISNAQRAPISGANFVATVYHGLPLDLYQPNYNPRGGYLAFLGRIAPEKRPDQAIAIARAAGIPLRIAAKVDKVDEAYFREVVAPLLKGPGVEFIGEINERAKTDFLGEASFSYSTVTNWTSRPYGRWWRNADVSASLGNALLFIGAPIEQQVEARGARHKCSSVRVKTAAELIEFGRAAALA